MRKVKFKYLYPEGSEKRAVSVDSALIIEKGRNLIALQLQLDEKRCQICGEYANDEDGSGLIIETENSDENTPDTIISFPEYKDWMFFAFNIFGKTLNVCLVKRCE
jgi:hypothetical protein